MGRKVNHASVKISKDEKQNFNSLIKVLRPKVYIIDSPSFKKLVQELTGNNNGSLISSTTLSPTPLEQNMVENCPFTHSESTTSTVDGLASAEETSNNSSHDSAAALMNDEFNQVCNQFCLDDGLEFQTKQQPFDQFLAFQNLESLLFDVEANNPFYNCYQQDVSIYDYELSGLL